MTFTVLLHPSFTRMTGEDGVVLSLWDFACLFFLWFWGFFFNTSIN